MKRIFFALLFAGLTTGIYAQKAKLKLADSYFERYQFASAAKAYEEAASKDSTNMLIIERLTVCYKKMNNSSKEEFWLSTLCKSPQADSRYFKRYGEVLAENGKYEESETWFKKYSDSTQDEDAKKKVNAYGLIKNFSKVSPFYKVEKVKFNSEAADFSPAFYKNDVVFCSSRNNKGRKFKWDGSSFIDLYISKGDSVSSFHKMINSPLHEGPLTFTSNYDTLFFTRNNEEAVKTPDKMIKLKICYSTLKNGEWTKPLNFQLNNNAYSIGHPALAPDGRLYFVSDMPGGQGGTDIYYTKMDNGNWATPVNLGPGINTKENEMFPYVDSKGDLFFSSNGHLGLGGLDVFHSKGNSDNTFGKPENVGAPVNSSKDDFGFILKNDKGYFSSNRGEDYKDDNIYSVLIDKTKTLNIVAVEKNGNLIENFTISLINAHGDNSSEVSQVFNYSFNCTESYQIKVSKKGFIEQQLSLSPERLTAQQNNDTIIISLAAQKVDKKLKLDLIANTGEVIPSGLIEIKNLLTGSTQRLPIGKEKSVAYTFQSGESYLLMGSSKEFKTKTMTITSPGVDSLEDKTFVHLVLSPVNTLFDNNNVGQIIEMDIKYDLGKFNIRKDAAKELDRLVKYMKKYPSLKVELGSHTDSRGADEANFRLSQKRAEAAVNYVVTKGIKSNRLIPIGYGKNDLKIPNATSEDEHQQNRRTTVKIVGN
jgi:outer membrane protein OmpA-like peptidoglycan-associated protein